MQRSCDLCCRFWAKDPPESEQRLEARTSSDTHREGV